MARGVSEKSIWRPGFGLAQSDRRGIKISTFEMFCEGRTIGIRDGLDVGNESNGEVPGLSIT